MSELVEAVPGLLDAPDARLGEPFPIRSVLHFLQVSLSTLRQDDIIILGVDKPARTSEPLQKFNFIPDIKETIEAQQIEVKALSTAKQKTAKRLHRHRWLHSMHDRRVSVGQFGQTPRLLLS